MGILNLAKNINKAKNASLRRKIKNRESLSKYLPEKGRYIMAKADAKNAIKEPRLKYKLKKRAIYGAGITAADTQNTIRQNEKERTKRAEMYANKDLALSQWSNQFDGNPSVNGAEGSNQNNSTTTINNSASNYIQKWRV